MPTSPSTTAGSRSRDRTVGVESSLAGRTAGLSPVRGRRRPWLLGLGALLATLGGLTVVWLVGAAGDRQEVLAVRTDVAYGQALTAEDVTTARVSVDPGVAVLPTQDADAVIGLVASTRLSPGMLLTTDMVEPAGEPGAGRVLVPIAVPADRMPAGGLRPDDRLLTVDIEGAGDMAPTPATVVRVGPADINGMTVVDVTTATQAGPDLAVAAANGHVALVVQPSGN
ncbi:MAG: SAF domain-containing protein [Actinomycetota bacterium]|nr:SAF domain-containing protein [Actinomycetota bacterium]